MGAAILVSAPPGGLYTTGSRLVAGCDVSSDDVMPAPGVGVDDLDWPRRLEMLMCLSLTWPIQWEYPATTGYDLKTRASQLILV